MAVDLKPPTWITGWDLKTGAQTLAAPSIIIPLSSLTGLTDVQADPITGDIRYCVQAILEKINAYWLSKTPAELPVRMVLDKGGSISSDPTVNDVTYSARFSTTVSTALRSEPT